MTITKNINGVSVKIFETGESAWGPGTTDLLTRIVDAAIFTGSTSSKPLVADLNLGASYGILTAYVASRTSPVGTTGLVRLANGDTITWRNAANNGNIVVAVNGQNMITIDGKATIVNNDGGDATKKIAFDSSTATASTTTTILSAASANQTVTIPDGSFTIAKNSDLTDHVGDTTGAHAASAISNTPSGNLTAIDVQNALNELQSDIDTRALASDLSNHLSDTVDAHDASAISVIPNGNLSSTEVQAALQELQGDVDARVNGLGTVIDNRLVKTFGTDGKSLEQTGIIVDDSNNITGVTSITVGNTGLTVGTSVPFSDSTGTLTLQNVDALDATTEATIESAIDTLVNLTSIQNQSVSLSGGLTVESASVINQDVTSDASPTFASIKLDENGAGTETVEIVAPTVTGNQIVTLPAVTGTLATLAGTEILTNKDIDGGTASDSNRVTLPKNTNSNLNGLTRKQGTMVYNTTDNKVYVDNGSSLGLVGGGGGLTTQAVSLGDFIGTPKNFIATAGKHYLIDMASAAEQYKVTLPAGAAEAVVRVSVKNNENTTYPLVIDAYSAQSIWYNDTPNDDVSFPYAEQWAELSWDSVDSHWIVNDGSTPLSGTWSGSLDMTGTLKVDTIQEHTATKGVAIQGRTDGTAVASGYVGEVVPFTSRTVTGALNNIATNTSALAILGGGRWLIIARGSYTPSTSITNMKIYVASNSTADFTGAICYTDIPFNYTSTTETSMLVLPQLSILDIAAPATQGLYAKSYSGGIARDVTVTGFAIRIA